MHVVAPLLDLARVLRAPIGDESLELFDPPCPGLARLGFGLGHRRELLFTAGELLFAARELLFATSELRFALGQRLGACVELPLTQRELCTCARHHDLARSDRGEAFLEPAGLGCLGRFRARRRLLPRSDVALAPTEGLLLRVVDKHEDLSKVKVGDVMTANPGFVRPEDPMAFAVNKMAMGGYRHVPVLREDGTPVSILLIKDVLRYLSWSKKSY